MWQLTGKGPEDSQRALCGHEIIWKLCMLTFRHCIHCIWRPHNSKSILKNLNIVRLMAHFHNAPSNFANLTSGRRALAIGTHNFAQKSWKRNFSSQNWSENNAKIDRVQEIYNIFNLHGVTDKMTKTGTAAAVAFMKCISKIYF